MQEYGKLSREYNQRKQYTNGEKYQLETTHYPFKPNYFHPRETLENKAPF
jgi:hypothetical protein